MSQSLNDKLEAYFKARPNVWIDGKELAQVAGGYGWRSRCSDMRKRGLDIRNKQVRRNSGKQKWVESYYRYVPADLFSELHA